MHGVHPKITADISQLLEQLGLLGIHPVQSTYHAEVFGDYVVELSSGQRRFSIVRDRSQCMIDGNDDELRRVGLQRAFNSKEEFEDAVLCWLRGA
jgi:hypothetical protein